MLAFKIRTVVLRNMRRYRPLSQLNGVFLHYAIRMITQLSLSQTGQTQILFSVHKLEARALHLQNDG
jgi:hypothetical protein